jgi:N-acetylmuramoyl-L-alanine amidase
MFLAASFAAASFCSILGASLYGPASAALATDVPATFEVSIPAPAPPFTQSELTVLPSAESVDIADPKPIVSSKSVKRAASLNELVLRHAGATPSDREAECLAGAVYFESKGEPLAGQLAVAETILNRSKSGRFPGSLCGVVFQKSQFSFVRSGGFPPIARGSQNWKTAVAIGHIARSELWESNIDTALYFHAARVSPGWRLKRLGTIGNHIFYR